MNVLEVYTKKEYECKKCKSKIYYAKLADDTGKMYTVDGQPPNGKFGKESNVLSAPVDVNNKDTVHKCNLDYVTKKIAEIEGNKPVNLDNFSPEFVSEQELQIWNDIVAKCTEYAILSQKKMSEYPEIQNPALKGLITKTAFEVLSEMKRRSYGDES